MGMMGLSTDILELDSTNAAYRILFFLLTWSTHAMTAFAGMVKPALIALVIAVPTVEIKSVTTEKHARPAHKTADHVAVITAAIMGRVAPLVLKTAGHVTAVITAAIMGRLAPLVLRTAAIAQAQEAIPGCVAVPISIYGTVRNMRWIMTFFRQAILLTIKILTNL